MSLINLPITTYQAEAFFGADSSLEGFELVTHVATDSRKSSSESVFFALPGVGSNGWDYLKQVAEQGTKWAVVPNVIFTEPPEALHLIKVTDVVASLGRFIRTFSGGYPANIIGVTGTNGKSSISYYSAQLAQYMGLKSGMIGTFGVGELNNLQSATHTTPDLLSLHEMVLGQHKDGVENLTFEVSSHALDQRRTEGVPIDVAIFSNLSRDHLDYHGTMDAYAEAKSRLFQDSGILRGVIFSDNEYSEYIRQRAKCPIYSYSLKDSTANFYASDIVFSMSSVTFSLKTPWISKQISLPLLGEFNVANAMAALAANWDLFEDKKRLLEGLNALSSAPGRMQRICEANKPLVVVDYAHTPDALAMALQALHQHVDGKIICIYGCGGDRDKGKRPLMTSMALTHADEVYLTSDNPRTEDPETIIQDAIANVDGVEQRKKAGLFHQIVDRSAAIETAIRAAGKTDAILIAGKGHENYQEVQNVRHYFDDVEEAKKALSNAHQP